MGEGIEALAGPVLREAAATELDLSELPGNSAKIRLILDLARDLSAAPGPLRVLDVGAGGRHYPFQLWTPFLPVASRLSLVGVDVAQLEPTARQAAAIGFPVDLRPGGVEGIVDEFGKSAFDVVVSTQVLEHLPDWRGGVAQMAEVLKPGGRLYVTCDSGDYVLSPPDRLKLAAKRIYARAAPFGGTRLSGEWEQAPTLAAVREQAERLGLDVQALRQYGLRELKLLQKRLDARGRLLGLALEEALAPGDPGLFRLIYLSAVKPSTR